MEKPKEKIVEEQIPVKEEKKDEWELREVATATSPVLVKESTEEVITIQDVSLAQVFLKILNKLDEINKKL